MRTKGELVEEEFVYSRDDPLDVHAVLLDEASMLDLPLAAALLDALPRNRPTNLVLIGALPPEFSTCWASAPTYRIV